MNQRTLTVTQLRRLRKPTYRVPLHVSPDGSELAVSVMRDTPGAEVPDAQGFTPSGLSGEAVGSRVLVVNTATGAVEEPFSAARTSWGGQWSPDGTMLVAYVQQQEEPPGLGIWHRDTGAVRQLPVPVRPFFGFEVPRWTPDSRSVIVKLTAASSVAAQQKATPAAPDGLSAIRVFSFDPEPPESPESPPATPAMTEAPATLPGWADGYRCDLAQVMVHTGDVTVLAPGWSLMGWEVAPDGHAVAVLRYTAADMSKQQFYYDLTTVPLDGSLPTVLARRIPQEYGIKLSWSPDSRSLAYVSEGRGHPGRLWVVPADGSGEPTDIAAGEDLRLVREEEVPRWSDDGERLYCLAKGGYWECAADGSSRRWIAASTEDELQQLLRWVQSPQGSLCWQPEHEVLLQLARHTRTKHLLLTTLNLASGQTEMLAELVKAPAGGYHGMEVAPDGSAVYLLLQAADHPPELWQLRDGFRTVQRLASFNPALDETALGMSRLVTWRGADGSQQEGTLLLPPQYVEGQALPTIVEVYGGREGSRYQHVFGGSEAMVPGQFLASRGYAVFYPSMPLERHDPLRRRDPLRKLPGLVLPAINRLIDLGIADPQRLGLMGNSYGSYCTLALLTQTDRFQAAVVSAVYANLTSVYGALDEHGHSGRLGWCESGQARMGGSLWEQRDAYIENSPLFYLDRVTTPLLIGSGTVQAEEPAQAGEVFSALRRLGQRVELRLYEGEDHAPPGWSEPSHRDFAERVVQWFAIHLKGAGG